jgi:hypothetical protein
MPTIRICSENEHFFKNFDFWCYLTGVLLLVFSGLASACLHVLGSNDKMPSVGCPIFFKKVCTPFITWFQKILNPITSGLKNMFQCTGTLLRICNYKQKAKHQNKENNLPPMHQAIKRGKYGRWCLYSVLGGLDGALNGQVQSTFQILRSERDNEQKWKRDDDDKWESYYSFPTFSKRYKWQSSNVFVKWWIKYIFQKYENQPLHTATELGDTVLIEMIIENGYDIEEKNWIGQTALHIAAANGHLACLKYLIDKGAELEAKDNDKLTPLLLSAQNGQLECLKYLIDKGADLKAKDYYKKNTASFICSEWTS